ncbi:unnamed protein product [Spirodela intermedia]|uniref:Uncharacterized protein n=1 Tax=Spirodela intermedia TaxID=51605 RepID=A0A811G733_SPIIN|nr:unnamed protein product [Spirodela intermedia]
MGAPPEHCQFNVCVTCTMSWASCKDRNPTFPPCKLPFGFLIIHRIPDWIMPLSAPVDDQEATEEDLSQSSTLLLSSRRWGDHGHIRAGHKEVRPVN